MENLKLTVVKAKWSENANIGYYAQDHNADF